jgi:hypothetical protein
MKVCTRACVRESGMGLTFEGIDTIISCVGRGAIETQIDL